MKKLLSSIFCVVIVFTYSSYSQTLIWTSPSYPSGTTYTGWFVLQNNPLELQFYTFDYSNHELKIMDGPLSSTPLLEMTLDSSESFSDALTYDYSGDGLNDLILIRSYPPPNARYGLRFVDVSNGQILFTFDDNSYSYGFEIGLPADIDGDGHTDIVLNRADINFTAYQYLVYSTNGIPSSISSKDIRKLKAKFRLDQNFPNPFNPSTTIQYSISSPGRISIKIYNAAGQLIKEMIKNHNRAGMYNVTWDGKNNFGQKVSSGVYFYQLTAGSYSQAKKMILLK